MRLFVEEGGKRKAFRIGEGVLAIGSGQNVQLQLSSPEVAAQHARIEIKADGGVRLSLEPGVLPPKIDGIPMAREAIHLHPGRKVQFGSSFLWIEDEEKAATRPTPDRPAVQVKSTVRRTAARKRSGMPIWAVSGLSVLIVGLVFLLIWRAFLISAEQAAPEVSSRLSTARALIDSGRFDDALKRLDLVEAQDLDESEQSAADALREEIADIRATADLALENRKGGRLLAWLEKYESESLAGAPSVSKVRLFLKRSKQFREEFPDHPAIDWLDRQELRFAGLVDMQQAPEWESVKWEARSFIRGMPRNYAAAFELVSDFVGSTGGEGFEYNEATRYLRLLGEEREEHHHERITTAQALFEAGQDGQAVWWLVHQVIWSGEPELANQAARVLIKMPDAAAHLRGYRDGEPEKYEALMENRIVQKYFRASEIHR